MQTLHHFFLKRNGKNTNKGKRRQINDRAEGIETKKRRNISNGARMKIILKCWNKHGADQKNNGRLSRDAHPKPVRKQHALA